MLGKSEIDRLALDFASDETRRIAAEEQIAPILAIATAEHMREALVAAWIRGFVIGSACGVIVGKDHK